MIHTYKELPFTNIYNITRKTFTYDSVFFDIETTGFSPKQTQLYLIGCAYRKDDHIVIEQFYAENMQEEKEILCVFFDLLASFHTIITFNGIGFDIPYLKTKCLQFDLSDPFIDFSYVDIFKSVHKLKHILKLENYKQKSIEQFLQLSRDDLYSGGDLIPIYHAYCKEPTDNSLSLLLLHNYEDVLGMIELVPILSYVHLFQGHIKEVSSFEVCNCKNYDGSCGQELILTIVPQFELPQKISYRFWNIYLTAYKSQVQLVIPIIRNDLKYFFPNWKDYYYLPLEDIAVPKSIASYVDKEQRQQAKASTCYTKKTSAFLPQFNREFSSPAFYQNYGDKISYFEYSDALLEKKEFVTGYVKHILSTITNPNLKLPIV